ncbi:hypothetical protein [Aquabacterium sp.]|uniref:hypothetical protein n=1 Tax=Aquabacterium sp. TaxID=1872578 RepID=UPI002BA304B6|nr:hypothetical protein [Aquabacterium sp.]HSW06586.1 hypothetical protein [Aquabacterium sp.]
MSTTTMTSDAISTPTEQLLRDYQREDRRIQWLLRGIAAVALALALLSVSALV